MFMFLPFLVALVTTLTAVSGNKKVSYVLWLALVVITLLSFKHHATDPLNLSF